MAGEAKRSGGGRGKKSSKRADAAERPRVDAVLTELEAVVEQLEGGELPLEEALARFESGVKLAKDGAAMLDAMERRVEVLLADADGAVTREPFESEEEQEEDDDHL